MTFPAFLADTLASVMVGKGREELVFTAPAGGVLPVSTWRPRVFGPVLKRPMVGEFPVVTSARSPAHRGVARDQRRRQREGRADDARSRVRGAHVGHLRGAVPRRLGDGVGRPGPRSAPVARICCGPARTTKRPRPECPVRACVPAMTRVGVAGFEPTTSSSRTKHATKLRHTPREATTAYRTGPPRKPNAFFATGSPRSRRRGGTTDITLLDSGSKRRVIDVDIYRTVTFG